MQRLVLLILLALPSLSQAAVSSLYTATVVAENQSSVLRQQLSREALATILLRVVGAREKITETATNTILAQAPQWVTHYHYEKIAGELTQQRLTFSFDKRQVELALTALNLPIWPWPRPDILLWLIVNQQGKQQLISSEQSHHPLVTTIQTVAEQRAMPIVLPLLDLHDQYQLRYAETAQRLTSDNLFVQAAKRYGVDVVLLAKMTKMDDKLTIDWQYLYQGQGTVHQWRSTGEVSSDREYIAQGIHQLADELAGKLARIQLTLQRHYRFIINNVEGFNDYSRIMSYLKNRSEIKHVSLTNLQNQQLTLAVELTTSLTALNSDIGESQILRYDSAPSGDKTAYYRYMP